jgi:hypothetical protein
MLCEAPVSCAGGCAASDVSGNVDTMQIAAPSSFGPGRWGGGLSVAGSAAACASNASAPTMGFPATADPITIELWARVNAVGQATLNGATGFQGLLAYGTPATQVFDLDLTNASAVSASSTFAQGCVGNTTANLADGDWHFLALSFTPNGVMGGDVALYADGQRIPPLSSTTLYPEVGLTGATFSLGYSLYLGACSPFDGQIDEVRVLDFAATDQQIATDFVNAPYEAVPGTVALWHFDEGAVHRCCPSGSACESSGACSAGPIVAALCPSAAPVACDDGTSCCGTGLTCGASGGCDDTGQQLPPREGVTGPACGADLWCPGGDECVAGGCCPAADTVRCGSDCCQTGSSCQDGACSCPPTATPCGSECCPSGSLCEQGKCRSPCDAPAFPTVCGAVECCPSGVGCSGGACGCPSDHPTGCGSHCCLPGAACLGGDCGCPAGMAQCGSQCCAEGETCTEGACAAPMAAGSTSGGAGGTSFWANWSCGSSSQCASLLGATSGSAGPMCTLADCNAWGNKFIAGGYSCSTTATSTNRTTGSPAHGTCFQSGVDF